jgi:hypothetical protein
MRSLKLVAGTVIIVVALSVPGIDPHLFAAAAPSGGDLSGDAADAAAIVDRFQALLESGDTAGATALLDPGVVIFEGGSAERSRAEYVSHHLDGDAAFLKTATTTLVWRTGIAQGDIAWIATQAEIVRGGEKPLRLDSTETMILKRGPEGWRITHIHWSSEVKK